MPEWRDVVGFEGLYQVSDEGQLKTVKTQRIRKLCVNKKALYTSLRRDRKQYAKMIHTLVLEAFVGPRPSGAECCHYDGDFRNNNLENLRWDTSAANEQDKFRHGTRGYGEDAPGKTKLTLEQVREIRTSSSNQPALANLYNVNQSTISRIKNGERWAPCH